MESVLVIATPQVSVVPGATATVELRIRNNGTIVEGYELTVLGEPAAWAEVVPATVTAYPKTEAVASILFRPPTGPDAPAGALTYGVRARSMSPNGIGFVEEAVVTVVAEVSLHGEVRPATVRAFRQGTFHLNLRNDGNAPARVRVRPYDEDERVTLTAEPNLFDLAAGASELSVINAKAPLNLSATERNHNLVVEYAEVAAGAPAWAPLSLPDGQRPAVERYTFTQRRILTRPVKLTALLALLAGLLPVGKAVLLKAPKVPKLVSAVSASETAIDIAWDPVAKAKGYRLRAYKGKSEDAPPVGKPKELEAEDHNTEWTELEKGTGYCFRIQSIGRFSTRSGLSDRVCASTGGEPVLPIPQDVKISKAGEVTWTADPRAATLQHEVTPAGDTKKLVVTKPGASTAQVEVPKEGQLCIEVTAFDPATKVYGPPSSKACVSVETWALALLGSDDSEALARAVERAQAVFGPGSVEIRFNSTVKLREVVLKQTFDTEDDARAFCTSKGWDKVSCFPQRIR